MTRSTAAGFCSASGSFSTGRNVPLVSSSGCDTASLRRSSCFGVKTISGLCSSCSVCRRSRWKYDAGVDGWATVIAFSAHSAMNRSIRADEWSGPWPS